MILGVLADTHIPDRARNLHPQVISIFRSARVEAILHCGDVSVPRVLAELEEVAPVHAVRGNRDWFFLRNLPRSSLLLMGGVPIGLTHGHGHWRNYLFGRARYYLEGYRLERFLPRMLTTFPTTRVIIFGHTHRPLNSWIDGKLIFNPGSAHLPDIPFTSPSIGLLHISEEGQVKGEIIDLD